MANIKSAKKRILIGERNAARNKAVKSRIKTEVRKVTSAIAAGDVATAKANLVGAESVISKAATKGVIPKNTSSRKISRLAQAVNKLEAAAE
jgi:small subunit ribosomal protein S20